MQPRSSTKPAADPSSQRLQELCTLSLPPALHTLREAAVFTRRGQSTLRAAARRRELAHTRLGRRLLFETRDLIAYIASGRVEAR